MTVGIIGAGRLGTALAKRANSAGYHVYIANSRSPETLKLILSVLLPGVKSGSVEQVIKESELVILAIPLNQYKSLSAELLKNKIVIDAMNYWPPTEGELTEFEDTTISSSEYIQSFLQDARVVKSLNHVAYNELEEHALEQGSRNRRAIALVGDDKSAKEVVSQFIDAIGFDPADIGALGEGRHFQPDTKLFNVRFTKDELRELMDS